MLSTLSLGENPIKVPIVLVSRRISANSSFVKAPCLFVAFALLCGVAAAQQTAVGVEALIRQGKFAEAQNRLDTLSKANPNDPHISFLQGDLQRKQGKYFAAEKSWRAALEGNPKSAETLSSLGQLYSDERRISEAIPLVEKLKTISPTAKTRTLLAELYMKSGEFEKSLVIAKGIPPASRPDKLLPVMVADYIGLKRNDDIQKAMPEILKRAPANPDIVAQLANVFLQAGMVGDASELLKLAQTRLKPTASLLTAQAQVQMRSGQKDEAVATLKRALEMDPDYPDALWGAARLAGSSGDWTEAVALLKRMERVAPPRLEVLQNLVFAAMQVNDLQTAHDAALDLQDLQPDSLDSVLTMATVLIRGSHWGEAEPLLTRALAQYPNEKRVQLAKGIVDYNLGNLAEGEKNLKASLGQGAGDAEAHFMLGLIAKQQGDISAATQEMEAAHALDAKKPEVLSSLGQFYLQLNEVDKARGVLEQAVKALPDDAQNHYQLAMAYRKLGMAAESREQMEMFQRLSARHVPQPTGEAAGTPR